MRPARPQAGARRTKQSLLTTNYEPKSPSRRAGDQSDEKLVIVRGALYALRKQTPEPVFGIIKSVMGFRQFLLRGLDCVRGEWSLVTMAWNIKRMHALSLG